MNYIYLIIFIFIWIWWIYLAHPSCKSIVLDKLKPRFKTGDIILFHALDNINPVIIGSYFGHVAIIYVDPDDPNGEPYIFESSNPTWMCMGPQQNPNGIFLSKLTDRLRRYKGLIYYKELSHEINPDICRGFKNFIKYAHENMAYECNVLNAWHSGLISFCTKKTNCGETVFLSLIKLGLIPESEYYNITFHYLLKMVYIKKLLNGYYYKDIIRITDYPF